MGAITLPDRGPIYMDACGFIYSVERIEPYRALMEPVWRWAQTGQSLIVTSELSIVETMVKPLREGDAVLQRLFRDLLNSSEVRLVPTTRALREAAAEIRAALNLRTPDALHAATSIQDALLPIRHQRQRLPARPRSASGCIGRTPGLPCPGSNPAIGEDQPATSCSDEPATSATRTTMEGRMLPRLLPTSIW